MEIIYVVLGVLLVFSMLCYVFWSIIVCLCITGALGKFLQFTFGHNHEYSKVWDSKVIETLNTSKVKTFDKDTITFENGVKVWIENKYYGYAQDSLNMHEYRTSWKTAKRLMKLEKELFGGVE